MSTGTGIGCYAKSKSIMGAIFNHSCILTFHTTHGLVPEVEKKKNAQEGILQSDYVHFCTRRHLVASSTSANNDSEELSLGGFCFEIACQSLYKYVNDIVILGLATVMSCSHPRLDDYV